VRGRWRIVHIDDGGQRNVRVIRPLGAHPQLPALIAWCELRQRQRGFLLRQIESAVDMRDGRRIDVGAWVAARRPGSRAESRAGGLGASTVSPASLGQAAAASARRRRR
jgi:predicted DNA-binding transcriptional regulator YafY